MPPLQIHAAHGKGQHQSAEADIKANIKAKLAKNDLAASLVQLAKAAMELAATMSANTRGRPSHPQASQAEKAPNTGIKVTQKLNPAGKGHVVQSLV